MIKAEWTNNDALSAEQTTQTNAPNTLNALDCISRQAAIDVLWKALYEYEDKTEKQFQESEDLDVGDWIEHRIFVQNMNDIDRQTILNLPSVHPDARLKKIEDLVDGSIDHFDRDDAMDLLYQIKEVLKDG